MIARQGQTEPVVIHMLISPDSIDEDMDARLIGKVSVQEALMQLELGRLEHQTRLARERECQYERQRKMRLELEEQNRVGVSGTTTVRIGP